MRRHVLKYHSSKADTLLATTAGTAAPRYWCPAPSCPKSQSSDSGFAGWLEYQNLKRHLLQHECTHERGVTTAAVTAFVGTPESSQTAGQQGSAVADARTVAAGMVEHILPVQGRFWCPHAECLKSHGNDFRGYSTAKTLQRHLREAHKRSQENAEHSSDVAPITSAAAAEGDSIAVKVDGRFWCPEPDCSKSHGSDTGFKGYAWQKDLLSHFRKAHKTRQHHADADPGRPGVRLGKRGATACLPAPGSPTHTAEPAPKRHKGQSDKPVATAIASSQPESATTVAAEAEISASPHLDHVNLMAADAEASKLAEPTTVAADADHLNALLPNAGQVLCPDATCPQQHGSNSNLTEHSSLHCWQRRIAGKRPCRPQLHPAANAACNSGRIVAPAELPLPDRIRKGAAGGTEALQQLSPEAQADDRSPRDVLPPGQGRFWCPDLNCPKRHRSAGFAGFRCHEKLQRHVARQRHRHNGHQSSACESVLGKANTHSSATIRLPRTTQPSRAVADLHPSRFTPKDCSTASLAQQAEGVSPAAAQPTPVSTLAQATPADTTPPGNTPRQAVLAGQSIQQVALLQTANFGSNATQAAAAQFASVPTAVAGTQQDSNGGRLVAPYSEGAGGPAQMPAAVLTSIAAMTDMHVFEYTAPPAFVRLAIS